MDALDRFVSRVEFGECWTWTGNLDREGYGTFNVGSRKFRAHRWLYSIAVGDIPDGLVCDHLCRNRACVNPLHIEIVTQRENLGRGKPMHQTHCKRGHEFDDANTRRYLGRRHCRACARRAVKAWKAANAA